MKPENILQSMCVEWFKRQYPSAIIMSIPNGAMLGGRNRFAMVNLLKKTGLLVGAPDLFIARANRYYSGMFVELKSAKGKLSESQSETIEKLIDEGYKVVVCKTIEEFISLVTEYMGVK